MNKVVIYGGLGNQMFQYALNTALNEKGNASQISFTDFFFTQHHNGFNLSVAFKLKLPFPLNIYKPILNYGGFLYNNKISAGILRKFITAYKKKMYKKYIEQKEFVFDKDVFNQKNKLILGTWQTEDYFVDIEQIIKKQFAFRKPTDDTNKALVDKIKNSNSISIHIRRGDYLKPEWIKTHLVIQDKSYYVNCIDYCNSRVEQPHYFIFSDDINWVKENLSFPNCTFIDHNKNENSYIDMYLMSLCKHNIIANSTFSWWGAWLNSNKNKIILMPEKWLNIDTCEGIFSTGWLKMKV